MTSVCARRCPILSPLTQFSSRRNYRDYVAALLLFAQVKPHALRFASRETTGERNLAFQADESTSSLLTRLGAVSWIFGNSIPSATARAVPRGEI